MASSPLAARRHSAALSRVGSSKNHSALARIIAVISTTPSPTSPPRPGCGDPPKRPPSGERGGSGVDLRLRLGPSRRIGGGSVERDGGGPTEQSGVEDAAAASSAMAESGHAAEEAMAAPAAALAEQSLSPAASVVGGGIEAAAKSSEGECDPEEENVEESREATAKEADEKASAEQRETKGIGAARAGTTTATAVTGDRGSLDLLLEAVRQVSGGLFDDDGPSAEKPDPAAATPRKRRSAGGIDGGKKQREEEEEEEDVGWCAPFDLYEEETAPIVRSKRGRNQALPSRYRDSILDPWRKPAALRRTDRHSIAFDQGVRRSS